MQFHSTASAVQFRSTASANPSQDSTRHIHATSLTPHQLTAQRHPCQPFNQKGSSRDSGCTCCLINQGLYSPLHAALNIQLSAPAKVDQTVPFGMNCEAASSGFLGSQGTNVHAVTRAQLAAVGQVALRGMQRDCGIARDCNARVSASVSASGMVELKGLVET